jgi:hypothetical protein
VSQPYPPPGPGYRPGYGGPGYRPVGPAPPPPARPSLTGLVGSTVGPALAVAGFFTVGYRVSGQDLQLKDIAQPAVLR